MFGNVYHRLLITLHLQLLGVVLTVLILLRSLNVTLIEFLVILQGNCVFYCFFLCVFYCFYLLSFFSLVHSDIVIAVFILGIVLGLL